MAQLKDIKLIITLILVISIFSCSSAQKLDDETLVKLEKAKTSDELVIQNNNRFKEIPNEIFKLKKLRVLSFSGSECDTKLCVNITNLPPKIGKFKKLTQLSLVMNGLKYLPNEINNLKLKSLDLSNNYDIDISNVKIRSLQILNLNDCNIKNLPVNIYEMVNLKVLGVEGNSDIPLREIDLLKEKLPNCIIYWK